MRDEGRRLPVTDENGAVGPQGHVLCRAPEQRLPGETALAPGDDDLVCVVVVGRTDERLKLKGVKLYSESVETVLAGFDDLTRDYRVTVSRPETTDRLAVVCEGTADTDALRRALSDRLLVAPDEVRTVAELDETGVVDERR